MYSRLASTVLLASCLAIVAVGCTPRYAVYKAERLPKGHSLVLIRVYAEAVVTRKRARWSLCEEGEIVRNSVFVFVDRYLPKKPKFDTGFGGAGKGYCGRSDKGKITAYKVLPGKYRAGRVLMWLFESTDLQFTFDVKPGEVVYIGDFVADLNTKAMKVRDNTEEAKKLFEEKFGQTGLIFAKRLMRKASDVPSKKTN